MRLMPIMALLTLALYGRGVFGSDPETETELGMEFFCPGDTAVIAEYDLCTKTLVANPKDACENLDKISLCFPKCFCEHPLGYNMIVAGLKSTCTKLPPCGGRTGSPAPSLRASAFTACIAGVVSLAGAVT